MTKEQQLPTSEYLNVCFSYDPDTGSLKWKVRPVSHFSHCVRGSEWEAKRRNSIHAGKEFGAINTHGHIRGSLDGSLLYAHRLIWKMAFGSEPEIIDHINGDPADNRLQNLRSGSRLQNQRNMKLHSKNTSGKQGVYLHRQSGGWYARITTKAGSKLSFYSKERSLVEEWRKEHEKAHGYSGRASQ